jgi:hypothetical protein
MKRKEINDHLTAYTAKRILIVYKGWWDFVKLHHKCTCLINQYNNKNILTKKYFFRSCELCCRGLAQVTTTL